MKKNVLMVILVLALAIMSVAETANYVITTDSEPKYSVSQYRFEDGYTITIDWSGHGVAEYEGMKYYYGCINDGIETGFYMWPAHVWGRRLLEHANGKDSAEYCAELTEWRW